MTERDLQQLQQQADIDLFERILSGRRQGVCLKCGACRTHSELHCRRCNVPYYTEAPYPTLKRCMILWAEAPLLTRSMFRPYYQGVIHKRLLESKGFSVEDFVQYCKTFLPNPDRAEIQ